MRVPVIVFLLLGALAPGARMAPGADRPPPPVLGGPEVTKLDWNTRGMVAADLDGDGLTDLALINNDRARLELLLQRPAGAAARERRRVPVDRWEPELEDARFDKRPLTAGITLFDLAVGDLNGDGRMDLVYTGDPDPLTIRLQSAAGDWDDRRVVDFGKPLQWLTSLRLSDLDGDGRTDLLVLTQKELVVLRQGADGNLGPPERYAVAEENSYSLELMDADGDGRRDVVYLAPNRRDALRIRRQQPGGLLGPETPHRIEAAKSTLQQVARNGSRALAFIQSQTGMLELLALRPGPSTGAAALRPRVFSTRAGAKVAPAYGFGDFDGDGRTDLALSDPDGAQVLVYFQTALGELAEARPFPSLADGRGLAAADWDGDGRAELFIASPKEGTLGLAAFTAGGRLGYPQPLPVTGKPVAVSAARLRPGGPVAVAAAVEEARKRRIDVLVRSDGGGAERIATVELEGLRTDPSALRFVDADQDGRADLAVFVPFEPMRLLVQRADGVFTDVSTGPGYRKGLVENLESAAVTADDADGDGREELIVAGAGFARALRLDATGALQVVDQFNAREAGAEIAAAMVPDLDGDGGRVVVLLDRKADQLQVLRRDRAGVFAFAEAVPAGRIELVAAERRDFDGNGRDDLFFLGKDRFWWIPLGAPDLAVDSLWTYESDLKEISYADVVVGDLNADGREDFVVIDPERNLLEVLVRQGDERPASVLHFKVFETDPHVQGRRAQVPEPRETLVADVTGDGRADLVLLVHDRVLVYPQQ